MIITRTPFRISFFGGGTDYPCYYQECGGAVLVTAINRYCYISLRHLPPFFNYKHRIVWSKTECVNGIDEIVHPSVRACLRYMNIQSGLEIHHDGDLPARSGLGSSSAFTVGLINALHALKGTMISNIALAEAAIYVEQELIKENVGSQDQTIAAFGGINVIRFNSSRGNHISVEPLCLTADRICELQNQLMLFFTGIQRNASDIAKEQMRITPQKRPELSQMCNLVDEGATILCGRGDIVEFGRLLHETWLLKRSLTRQISNPAIDDIYETAMQAGALGGKLMGAGGGGFMVFFVPPQAKESVASALGLLHVPFAFDFKGSHVIFYEPSPIEKVPAKWTPVQHLGPTDYATLNLDQAGQISR
jgi:D-glycero-alpha-D-manno-heptose-7-phosphate kinase